VAFSLVTKTINTSWPGGPVHRPHNQCHATNQDVNYYYGIQNAKCEPVFTNHVPVHSLTRLKPSHSRLSSPHLIDSGGTGKFFLSLSTCFPTIIMLLYSKHRQVSSSAAFNKFAHYYYTDIDKFLLPHLTDLPTTILQTQTSFFCHF
jgi:hypothetical protein